MSRHYTCEGCQLKLYGHPVQAKAVECVMTYMGQVERTDLGIRLYCSKKCMYDNSNLRDTNEIAELISTYEKQISDFEPKMMRAIADKDYEISKCIFNIIKHRKACINFMSHKITKKKYQEIVSDIIEYATENDEDLLDNVCKINTHITIITERLKKRNTFPDIY